MLLYQEFSNRRNISTVFYFNTVLYIRIRVFIIFLGAFLVFFLGADFYEVHRDCLDLLFKISNDRVCMLIILYSKIST